MNTKFKISELDWFVKQVKKCVKANREIMIEEYTNYLDKCNDGKTLSIEAYSLCVLGVNDPYFDFEKDLTKYLYNFINNNKYSEDANLLHRSMFRILSNGKVLTEVELDFEQRLDFYCDEFIAEAKKLGVKKFLNCLL